MDFGKDVAKWDSKPRANQIALPIKRQTQLKKPDAYKSINSSALRVELPPEHLKIAMDIIYSA